jgi:hypothetical protein
LHLGCHVLGVLCAISRHHALFFIRERESIRPLGRASHCRFIEGNFYAVPCSDSCEGHLKFAELSELADGGVKVMHTKIIKDFPQLMLLALATRVDGPISGRRADITSISFAIRFIYFADIGGLTAADRASQSWLQI